MGPKERREREREELGRVILDAARELFVAEGYQNVSMRKIAEKIEYSPTTIYLYFKDKADLLNQICEEAFSEQVRELEEIRATATDPIDLLRRGLRAYVDFGLSHRSSYILTFLTPYDPSVMPADFDFEHSQGAKAFGFLREIVSVCVTAGLFRPVDVETASQALWASAHGVTALLITDKLFPFVGHDALVDAVIDTSIRGLLADTNPPPSRQDA